MSKNVNEHENEYWHIRKGILGNLIMWIIGIFLVAHNITFITKAYPGEVSALIAVPCILLWIGIVIAMAVITAKTT